MVVKAQLEPCSQTSRLRLTPCPSTGGADKMIWPSSRDGLDLSSVFKDQYRLDCRYRELILHCLIDLRKGISPNNLLQRKLPVLCRPSRSGMNSSGRLSPSMTAFRVAPEARNPSTESSMAASGLLGTPSQTIAP